MKKIDHKYWPYIKEPVLIAFTAVVCLCFARLLDLPQGYWAVMSSIIVMQNNAQDTISASFNRLIGTAIGAVIGGIFLDLYGVHVWVFGVAVMIVVLICIFLNLKQSYRLAGVTVAIILLVNHPESPWMTALHRFLEVSLGVVVALLISLLMDPSYSSGILKAWVSRLRSKYFLFLIIFFLLSASAHCQSRYLTQEEIQRVKAVKQLLYGIDHESLQRTIDDLEKTRYPQINLEIKEATAKTYADLVGEYNITGQKKKEWLYSMVCLNMAYLQFGGGQGDSGHTSSLNRLICKKLKGYLPLNALKQHGMVYSLD